MYFRVGFQAACLDVCSTVAAAVGAVGEELVLLLHCPSRSIDLRSSVLVQQSNELCIWLRGLGFRLGFLGFPHPKSLIIRPEFPIPQPKTLITLTP